MDSPDSVAHNIFAPNPFAEVPVPSMAAGLLASLRGAREPVEKKAPITEMKAPLPNPGRKVQNIKIDKVAKTFDYGAPAMDSPDSVAHNIFVVPQQQPPAGEKTSRPAPLSVPVQPLAVRPTYLGPNPEASPPYPPAGFGAHQRSPGTSPGVSPTGVRGFFCHSPTPPTSSPVPQQQQQSLLQAAQLDATLLRRIEHDIELFAKGTQKVCVSAQERAVLTNRVRSLQLEAQRVRARMASRGQRLPESFSGETTWLLNLSSRANRHVSSPTPPPSSQPSMGYVRMPFVRSGDGMIE